MTFNNLINEIGFYMDCNHHHSKWDTDYLHWDKQTNGGNTTYRVWYSYPGKKFKIAICNNNMKVWHMDKVPGSIAKDRVLGPCVRFARHHDDTDTDDVSATPTTKPKSLSYPITVQGPIKRSSVSDFFDTLLLNYFLLHSTKVDKMWYTSVQYNFINVNNNAHVSIKVPAFGYQCDHIKINCTGKSEAKLDFTDLLFKFTYDHHLDMIGNASTKDSNKSRMSFKTLCKDLKHFSYKPVSYSEITKNGVATSAEFTNGKEVIGWDTKKVFGKYYQNIQVTYLNSDNGTHSIDNGSFRVSPYECEAKALIKKYLGK